jgi:hypothetical protein
VAGRALGAGNYGGATRLEAGKGGVGGKFSIGGCAAHVVGFGRVQCSLHICAIGVGFLGHAQKSFGRDRLLGLC